MTAGERPERVPLSFAQRRLWFIDQLEGPSATYNVPSSVRLAGEVDRRRWGRRCAMCWGGTRCCVRCSRRPTVSRTSRIFAATSWTWDVQVSEVASTDSAGRGCRGRGRRVRPVGEVPIRAWLFSAGPSEHVLVVVVHHIASGRLVDGAVGAGFVGGVRGAVRGPGAGVGAVAGAVRGLRAVAARDARGEDDPDSVIARQVGYWREALAGMPEELALPIGPARPAVAGHGGTVCRWRSPAEVHAAAGGAGAGRGCDDVHGVAGRAGGAAVAAGRRHRHPDRVGGRRADRRGAGRPGRVLRQHVGAAHGPVRRPDVRELLCRVREAGLGASPTRTCRSSGWWRSSRRPGPWPVTRCSR